VSLAQPNRWIAPGLAVARKLACVQAPASGVRTALARAVAVVVNAPQGRLRTACAAAQPRHRHVVVSKYAIAVVGGGHAN